MKLFSLKRPKIKVQSSKREGLSGWIKCSSCEELLHETEIEKNLNCCPKCDHHYRLPARQRIEILTDEGTFQECDVEMSPLDVFKFVDSRSYQERIDEAGKKTKEKDAVITGIAMLDGKKYALATMNFQYMGGSMGSVVGEKITRLIELACELRIPLVIVCASGGARMQESIYSLMQMAKISAALTRLHELKLPYISILTNPTSGGVTASFASLADIIIAEPKALICFAGPRVIEQTLRAKLPPEAQKSEFLLKRGMIDSIIPRCQLRKQLKKLLNYFEPICSNMLRTSSQNLTHEMVDSISSSEYISS